MVRDDGKTMPSYELTSFSGIFGYINYLVEKDRKFILDTLLNGMSWFKCCWDAQADIEQASHDLSTAVTILLDLP